MTHTDLLLALLLAPLAASLLAFASRWLGAATRMVTTLAHLAGISSVLVFSLLAVQTVMADGSVSSPGHWLYIDALAAVFIALIGVVGFLTGVYSIGYMGHEVDDGEIDHGTLCNYYGFFNLFLFTMLLVATANNVIMMWVAVEATTLGSAFLVGLYGQRSSLEAVWKYIIICTVGVAFGLYGTVLVYSNAANVLTQPETAIFWTVLRDNAKALDPTLIHISFVFVLIGFGTKAGLFPMHAWLPDAHSEAPSPVSALLSAVLLNCALLVIIRFYIIVSKTIGPAYPQSLLLAFGLMSIAVAAFFIVVQRDMKRLLAYSSVENMGLIALSIGIGGPLGILAALFHTINHSLAKALLFCGSGNILLKYGTRDLDAVKGVLKVAPLTGLLIGAGALALGGLPPFNIFVSEFMVVTAGISAGRGWLVLIVLLLLTIVLAGLVRMLAGSLFGPSPEVVAKGDTGALTLAPMAVLLALMLLFGICMPKPVIELVERAAAIVMDVPRAELESSLKLPWQKSDSIPAAAESPAVAPGAQVLN
ncbi:MAG: hydrogenase [Proteobacteria bacterium]|nr:hydrogenase [Pseudomonadota bacterium]